MPVFTTHFNLPAFVRGDTYSATIDRRRFLLIDSHLEFLSRNVTNGIIEGWTFEDDGSLNIKILPGMGVIDKFVTRTFGYYQSTVNDNDTVYVWMRRRPSIIGSLGAFTDLLNIEYADTVSPDIPADAIIDSFNVDTITLSWSANTEIDFDHYNIYISNDDSNFDKLDETTNNVYVASDLSDDTLYYFKITSVDFTGNESGYTNSISQLTDLDIVPPSDPTNVKLRKNDGFIQLTWRASSFGNILLYRAYVTPINQEGFDIGNTSITEVDGSKRYMSVLDLANGQKYRIILKAVGTNDIESSGITINGGPDIFPGPPDTSEIDVSDQSSDSVITNVVLLVEWASAVDEYSQSVIDAYEIRLEEINEDTIIVSEWVEVRNGLSRAFQVYPYLDNDKLVYRSIQERTQYTVTIRSIDIDGIRSPGVVAIYTTRDFVSPSAPSLFSVSQQDNQTLLVTWNNSIDEFAKNIFTFIKTDIASNTDSTIEDHVDLALAQQYIVENVNISPNTEYTFKIKAVDEFGNESQEIEVSYTIPSLEDLLRPLIPVSQKGYAGNKVVYLHWDKSASLFVVGYRVWRSVRKISYSPTDFVAIETITSDLGNDTEYIDYEVENDITYVYFITSIDAYGRESKNPIDDSFIDYKVINVTPVSTGNLDAPTDFAVTQIGNSVQLEWTLSGGQFDGYEIWRSIDDKHSFEKINTVGPSDTSYVDEDVLLKTDTYFYIVRKFRNESDILIIQSDIDVFGAIYLGKIITKNGYMTFDYANVNNIKNIEDPIRQITVDKLAVHKHEWKSDTDDRRINLGDTITISDWTTTDYRLYTTQTDISEYTDYTVYINGNKTEILYDINFALGELTFSIKLAKVDFDFGGQSSYPFDTPPTITVVFGDLEETQEILSKERIDALSAQQTISGEIRKAQLTAIDHEGRTKERLIPVQIETISIDDGYRFTTVSTDAVVGKATVFYDVIQDATNNTNILLASTSAGLLVSEDFGIHWATQFIFTTPIIGLFYIASIDSYLATSNRGVFLSAGKTFGGFSIWGELSGLENAKIVRDIVETNDGAVLASTDLGVFKLRKDNLKNSFLWRQTPLFGQQTTNAYAMLYDTHRNRIIVSNDLGIFVSTNEAVSWEFSSEMTEQRPIYAFVQSGSTIFAITDFIVWRRKAEESTFRKIAYLDVSMSRKIVVWQDRLFVTTDEGLQISDPDANIFDDVDIKFNIAFPQINRKSYISPVTSLNIIDNKLFVGTEERLYSATKAGKILLHSEVKTGVSPTIYVNGIEQKIGVRFTTDPARRYVCFDEKQKLNSKITVANQYKKFRIEKGGWVDADFTSKVSVYVDGVRINEGSLAEKPFAAMNNLQFPKYNDRTAHKAGADIALENVKLSMTDLLANTTNQSDKIILVGYTKDNLNDALYAIERFLSQLYVESRVVDVIAEDGTVTQSVFVIPAHNVVLLSCSSVFSDMGIASFGKYRDLTGDGTVGTFNTEFGDNGQTEDRVDNNIDTGEGNNGGETGGAGGGGSTGGVIGTGGIGG